MSRIRLSIPLNFYLNASDPSLLNPSLAFDHHNFEINVTLKGGPPLCIESGDEPHFRTISQFQMEIREKQSQNASLLRLVESKKYSELLDSLIPAVNHTLAAIRNFGWVTTAKEYKPEHKPELLLRAWEARARIRGKWQEIAPKPEKRPFDALYGLGPLEENVERGSLSVGHWRDIEQALVEDLDPNPEQEFLTNALQHLREENLRLALIEATVCLEIVLSESVKCYLEVKRHFPKKKIEAVLANVGLTSRVGLILDSILTHSERSRAELDKVLRAINLRNKIIHRTGHVDPSVPPAEVKDAVYAMLNLALMLGRKRDEFQAQPKLDAIATAIAEQFQCPHPEINLLRYHEVSVSFSFPSNALSFLRQQGAPKAPEMKIPDQKGLQEVVTALESKLKERDRYFDPKKHLSVSFKRGVLSGTVFATLKNGEWKNNETGASTKADGPPLASA